MEATTATARILDDRERGAAAVEFAIVVPLLLVLVLGIVFFGIAFNAHVTLTQASREGVRALALRTGDGETETRAAAIGLDPSLVMVSATSCPTPSSPGANAEILASYDVPLSIPFYTGPSTVTLRARAVMRCGG